MPGERGYSGSAVVGRHVFVMGGGNLHEWLREVVCLDTASGAWSKCADLSTPRGSPGCAAVGGRVYAAGGGLQDSYYDTVEVYDPALDRWTPGEALLRGLRGLRSVLRVLRGRCSVWPGRPQRRRGPRIGCFPCVGGPLPASLPPSTCWAIASWGLRTLPCPPLPHHH